MKYRVLQVLSGRICLATLFMFAVSSFAQHGAGNGEWPAYSGDKGSTKYSGLDQINKGNVANLEVTWRWRFPDNDTEKRGQPQIKVTPLMVNGVIYTGSMYQIVSAIASEHEESPKMIKDFLYQPEMLGDPNLNLSVSLLRGCQTLINDIMETLRYVFAQKRINHLDRLYLCGDFSLVKGFDELLDLHLPAQVTRWNPFCKMSYKQSVPGSELIETMGSAYAVAAGLAMRTL